MDQCPSRPRGGGRGVHRTGTFRRSRLSSHLTYVCPLIEGSSFSGSGQGRGFEPVVYFLTEENLLCTHSPLFSGPYRSLTTREVHLSSWFLVLPSFSGRRNHPPTKREERDNGDHNGKVTRGSWKSEYQ